MIIDAHWFSCATCLVSCKHTKDRMRRLTCSSTLLHNELNWLFHIGAPLKDDPMELAVFLCSALKMDDATVLASRLAICSGTAAERARKTPPPLKATTLVSQRGAVEGRPYPGPFCRSIWSILSAKGAPEPGVLVCPMLKMSQVIPRDTGGCSRTGIATTKSCRADRNTPRTSNRRNMSSNTIVM